jgi:hypothetical protein
MNTELQLVYTDLKTGRIARIADYTTLTCPADLEEFGWKTFSRKMLPAGIAGENLFWENTITREFKRHAEDLSEEDKTRISLLSVRAECLEIASRTVNGMRFTRSTNMFGNHLVQAEYEKELAVYKDTGHIGSLIRSLADLEEDVPVAIAELEIKQNIYLNFLVSSEIMWNRTSRRLKTANDPRDELDKIKKSLGI